MGCFFPHADLFSFPGWVHREKGVS